VGRHGRGAWVWATMGTGCAGMSRGGAWAWGSDEHGERRTKPGEVSGVGRFCDGLGYGHSMQVLSCQCSVCNRWEALEMFKEVRPSGVKFEGAGSGSGAGAWVST
jgi:hypothetical protein